MIESVFTGFYSFLILIESRTKIAWLRTRGYDIDFSVNLRGKNIFFQSSKKAIRIGKHSIIGLCVKICSGFNGGITIHEGVGIFEYTAIDIHNSLEIGANTLIAPFCYITDYDHILSKPDTPIIQQGYRSKPIIIGKNVWIGAKSVILKGVTIGDNTVIGAGSVVTNSIPANVLAAGNPAKVIRKLFK